MNELLRNYTHTSDEFPVLMQQTHKVLRDRKIVNEQININENIMHYLTDTALLISHIDGSVGQSEGIPYDHVVYLDKSARPVSWLVNMFWSDFAIKDDKEKPIIRPKHSYINIDRSPWFRNVGINVSDDGRMKENGELATYNDFLSHKKNLTKRHLAEIRALYINGGIEKEDEDWVMEQPTILDGKRVLIVDEVSRTGSTLSIATFLFKCAFPNILEITGTYFWHPTEPLLKMGYETVLTSLPIWYDPGTMTGRGIGGPNPVFFRKRYEYYKRSTLGNVDLCKLRAQAFSGNVYSAPLLNEDGTAVLNLTEERKTRALCKDLRKLYDEYKAGRLFFNPPIEWDESGRFEKVILSQGLKLIPENATSEERNSIMEDPLFYRNFIQKLRES